MAEHDVLKYALELKNGAPVSWEHVSGLAAQIQGRLPGTNVVLVD